MSFQLSIAANRRAAAIFIGMVHRKLSEAYEKRSDLTQAKIAESLGVHRSVINRQIRGREDMSLGRVAELAWALGLEADFSLIDPVQNGGNTPHPMQSSGFKMGDSKPTSGEPQKVVAMQVLP